MKILTANQLRTVDRLSGDTLTLMETAGMRVVEAIAERFENLSELRVCVLCGKGNNGGDGFVVARLLADYGCVPRVLLFAGEQEVSGDAAVNLSRLKLSGNPPVVLSTESDWSRFECDPATNLVVDALLGTGVTRPVEGLFRAVIETLPDRFPDAMICSVDIPSGLSADTGELIGPAVQADLTVTFTALKTCLVFPPACDQCGDILVAHIGNPAELVHAPEHTLDLIAEDNFPDALAPRKQNTHKGDYGKVLVIGGSLGRAGAASMAGQASLRSGAGLVTVATPRSCLPMVATSMPELMTEPLEETPDGTIANISVGALTDGKTVLAIGPGLGRHPETQVFARSVVAGASIPIVIDADALNAFVGHVNELCGDNRRPVVITPHPGEMSRLINRDIAFVNANRIPVAQDLATKQGLHVVLKGFRTVVAIPDGRIFICGTGNPGMATAGMGDILTGILAGIIAQENLGKFVNRVLFAVHLHGLAGDLAAGEIGEEPLVATDLLSYIGAAWDRVRE